MGEMVGQNTVRVSVEIRSATARFRVGIQAQSIRKALDLVAKRYPRGEVGLVLPIEPEGYFVRESLASTAMVGSEQAGAEAA